MDFITLGDLAQAQVPFGPSGKDVYDRTYSRIKDDGTRETWPETVRRVVDGNLGLVESRFVRAGERERLIELMDKFAIIPAGRHLWLSGVPGKQFINNCWVSGWTGRLADHFAFTFDQLMQGGGVGANYSNLSYSLASAPRVHLVLDPSHQDYEACKVYLSKHYTENSVNARAVEDTREGWVSALTRVFDAAQEPERDRNGYTADIIFDLSRIRASGTKIKTFGGTSAGPVPLAKLLSHLRYLLSDSPEITGREAMDIDHLIAECVVSGNVRRSARMSVMHWEDPNIDWFLDCKSDSMSHWSTNISVAIDNEFIALVQEALKPIPSPRAQKAGEVYRRVTEGMYSNGEPGFWNIELSNADEPNWVEATNPCGEITLPAWGVCNLGHINLDYFAGNIAGAEEAHELMARFLVRATFADIPSERARAVQDRDRRIGVGHFGLHGYLAKTGVPYSEAGYDQDLAWDLLNFKEIVRESTRAYAWELRIPEPVKVTTVAPTGTIAKMPGRSEGIHPIFAPYFKRRIRFSTVDPDQSARLDQYRQDGFEVEDDLYSANTAVVTIPSKEPLVDELIALGLDPDELLESAYDLTVAQQLAVQKLYQRNYADNAVSYTVNFDPANVSLEDLQEDLLEFLPFVKGTTVFPVVSRPQSPYEPMTKEEFLASRNTQVADGVDEECSTGACPVK